MMLFRPIGTDDLEDLYHLSLSSGVGLTTLSKEKSQLQKRVQLSIDSFAKTVINPGPENYLFALEDSQTRRIIGVSAIEAATGIETPFYTYKISRKTKFSHELAIRSDYDTLNLVNDYQAHTELCSLFLAKEFRKNHNGLLLSKARFLYMANYPHRFSDTVIAEIRGVSDKQGISPFWENVGKHFFKMDFVQADTLTTSTNKQFIADLMPASPIHVCLLDSKAQKVIGQPHESTIPALKILQKEGFRYTNHIDIFDAGPTVEAPLSQIKTIRQSVLSRIGKIIDEVQGKPYLVANTNLDFRASLASILYHPKENTCIISRSLAQALEVQERDLIRISQFN